MEEKKGKKYKKEVGREAGTRCGYRNAIRKLRSEMKQE